MPQPQTSGFIATRLKQLHEALVRFVGGLRRRSGSMRGFFGRGAALRARTVQDRRDLEARARFWSEVRAGQREAEALSGKRRHDGLPDSTPVQVRIMLTAEVRRSRLAASAKKRGA